MKLHYYPATDSLYIELKETPGAEVGEIAPGLLVDLDAHGDVVGFDVDHASKKLDLSKGQWITRSSRVMTREMGRCLWHRSHLSSCTMSA